MLRNAPGSSTSFYLANRQTLATRRWFLSATDSISWKRERYAFGLGQIIEWPRITLTRLLQTLVHHKCTLIFIQFTCCFCGCQFHTDIRSFAARSSCAPFAIDQAVSVSVSIKNRCRLDEEHKKADDEEAQGKRLHIDAADCD